MRLFIHAASTVVAAAAYIATTGTTADAAAAAPPPSFVFMMLDDVGWADFSFMGSNFSLYHRPHAAHRRLREGGEQPAAPRHALGWDRLLADPSVGAHGWE